ncbi:hypothetical protein HG537_0A06200 [Torulaspora globosa]|uniref:Protein AHC1 n=1 Tax=Torulaspora globosa TaxID=48254 RepID=A0A7H9HM53_9SACH|nr:hypothetical protein HG537_0A06200 [Torulaspora sp. CBS 2947]
MEDQNRRVTLHKSLGSSNNMESGKEVPTQVIFMDTHDLPPRTDTHTTSSGYYQVATPKSPHELILDDMALAGHGSLHNRGEDGCGSSVLGRLAGESEETERLKYETAKSEILEKLHLQTLISHKETQRIEREIKRVDAQMKLLETLHDDKELLSKIEEHHERLNNKVKRQMSGADAIASSAGYVADSSSMSSFANYSMNSPLSAGSTMPTHHYHTRSKSSGNVAEVPHLRPANSAIIDLRLAGTKSIPSMISFDPNPDVHVFRPNQMNLHHRRNYSSTCLTSNSGVVGKTENNEAIFRRYDGILVVINCSFCTRSGFTSAQGIVNHVRLKHGKTYSSQPLAVLNNQKLLEDSKQDPKVLEKFKEMGMDPLKEYLPSEIAIPFSASKASHREPSPKDTSIKSEHAPDKVNKPRATKHLEKLYNKEDFKDLVEMVKDASKDLEEVLKQPSPENSDSEEVENTKKIELQADCVDASPAAGETPSSDSSFKPESVHSSSSQVKIENNEEVSTSTETPPIKETMTLRKSQRKRKDGERELAKDLKERQRPAEKKVRPDVLALQTVPDHEKRSSHYNLRAKSKLRSNSHFL